MKITFVCTGNTCRSPMAEGILQDKFLKLGFEGCEASSAGLECGYGLPIAKNSQTILDERGILFSHTSQPLTQKLMEESDLVIVMTTNHKDIVKYLFADKNTKIMCANQFIGQDIDDPYGQSLEKYRAVASQIDKMIEKIINDIQIYKKI